MTAVVPVFGWSLRVHARTDRAVGNVDGDDGDDERRRALYVGDSRVDVTAAARAGVDSAFPRRPHRRDHDLELEPTLELRGLDGLLDL